MIEENIWYNGSRKKLEFNKFSGLFFLTTNKQLAVDYIDDGETCNGYLNTIDISKIKPYIFDYRTDFDKIKGMEFKSVWTNKIIVIDNNFKKLLARDWNKWSRTQPFSREHFINLILKPAGFKGYYNTETDHGVKYPAIAIFEDYFDELKVLNSKKIELETSDEYIEESFNMNLNEAKSLLEENGYKLVEGKSSKSKVRTVIFNTNKDSNKWYKQACKTWYKEGDINREYIQIDLKGNIMVIIFNNPAYNASAYIKDTAKQAGAEILEIS